jgi:sugar phosphate isomerase/epimerase
LCDFDEKIREESIKKIKKIILTMPELGSKILNVHPGFYPDKTKKEICFNNLIKSIKGLLPLLEKTKTNLYVENMAHKKKSDLPLRLMRSPEEFKKFFDIIKSDYINMSLDVPHACIAQSYGFYKDFNQWAELKPRIKHIHLGGFDGTENHHSVLLEESIVDYTFFYDLIRDFEGVVILENSPEQVFVKNREFLKKKFPKTL